MNEINAVYDIDDIQDLQEKIIDAVEISKKLETDAKTDTHFISGSMFGLILIENRLMSSFQLMVSYLWYQNPNIYVNENKHLCTCFRGSWEFLGIWTFRHFVEFFVNVRLKKNYLDEDMYALKNSVGNDLESLKQYLDRIESKDTSMEINSTLSYRLRQYKTAKDFYIEFQLFSNALIQGEPNLQSPILNDHGKGIYFNHSRFRFTSIINANIVKEEWLKKIVWKVSKNKNIKLKKEIKRVHEDQLKRIEQQILEIENAHDKHHQELMRKSNSELASLSITDNQRQKIQELYDNQFREMANHTKNRLEEIMEKEKENLEQRIIMINRELREEKSEAEILKPKN